MENEPMQPEKQNVSSASSMFPPYSTYPESTFSAPPPPYSDPSQYPPTSGMPYPQYYPNPNPDMGYPHPHAPPPGGQPYDPQPGAVYLGPTGFNYQAPLSHQHQQEQVVVNNQPMGVTPYCVVREQPVSMNGAIALSCFAFWCCGWLLGGIAFILAMVGMSSAAAGDTRGAIQMRKASYGLSIVGIVIGIIIIICVATATRSAKTYAYDYDMCYDDLYRTYYLC